MKYIFITFPRYHLYLLLLIGLCNRARLRASEPNVWAMSAHNQLPQTQVGDKIGCFTPQEFPPWNIPIALSVRFIYSHVQFAYFHLHTSLQTE